MNLEDVPEVVFWRSMIMSRSTITSITVIYNINSLNSKPGYQSSY